MDSHAPLTCGEVFPVRVSRCLRCYVRLDGKKFRGVQSNRCLANGGVVKLLGRKKMSQSNGTRSWIAPTILGVLGLAIVAYFIIRFVTSFSDLEGRAAELGKQINTYPESHWKDVFDEGQRLHRATYRGVTLELSLTQLEPIFADLGFEHCRVTRNGVFFDLGGGHMINSAGVHITLVDDYYLPYGVFIDGWQNERLAYNPSSAAPNESMQPISDTQGVAED